MCAIVLNGQSSGGGTSSPKEPALRGRDLNESQNGRGEVVEVVQPLLPIQTVRRLSKRCEAVSKVLVGNTAGHDASDVKRQPKQTKKNFKQQKRQRNIKNAQVNKLKARQGWSEFVFHTYTGQLKLERNFVILLTAFGECWIGMDESYAPSSLLVIDAVVVAVVVAAAAAVVLTVGIDFAFLSLLTC